MYKITTVGNKVIGTANSQMEAKIMAYKFANENCTFAKVYCGNDLISIISW